MAEYERTEEGHVRAMKDIAWMTSYHKRPFALYVDRMWPNKYIVSIPSLVEENNVEEGTAANLFHPDGSMTPMFPNDKS
jgi:hypothetical protein